MKFKSTVTVAILLISINPAFAEDKKVSTEDRLKMAEAHSKMAECLKSDKPMGDCKKEMMNSCKDMMGKDGCHMMGHKKGMMMNHDEETSHSHK